MRTLHRCVWRLKHWQIFVGMVCTLALVGYPLFLLGQRMLLWPMSFMDSPAPGVALFICLGVWLDSVLAYGEKPLARALSPILLLLLVGCSLWFRNSPFGMLIFLPAIAFIGWVLVPAAKAIHAIEQRNVSPILALLDALLIGCLFPFGVWILQPRLNAAEAKWTIAESRREGAA